MSETPKYNLRSRSKKVNYSEDHRDVDNHDVANVKQVSKAQRVKGQSQKTPVKTDNSQKKPGRSKKLTKLQKHVKEDTRQFQNTEVSSADDSPSEYDSCNMQSYHQENGSSRKTHGLEVLNGTRKSLPSGHFTGVRERLHGMSASGLIDKYQSPSRSNDREEFYSTEEEPDSTMVDDHSLLSKFGTISPIKHEVSYALDNRFETRDKMMSHGPREPRPLMKRHKSKEDILKTFRDSVGHEIVWSILGLIVISIIAVALILIFEDAKSIGTQGTRMARFESRMEKLKVQFPSQTGRLWRVVGGASFSHIKDPSTVERPIVLLLAGTFESATTVSCLATKLAAMFDDIFQSPGLPVVIKGNTYLGKDPDMVKIKIDDKLKSGFDSGSKSAIIHNIDNIPPCSILLFHSYCENDNAPYKDVAFVHTVQLGIEDVDIVNLRPKELEEQVGIHLKIIWDQCPTEMTVDKQDAILSRIANNVVMVKAEDTIDILKACAS